MNIKKINNLIESNKDKATVLEEKCKNIISGVNNLTDRIQDKIQKISDDDDDELLYNDIREWNDKLSIENSENEKYIEEIEKNIGVPKDIQIDFLKTSTGFEEESKHLNDLLSLLDVNHEVYMTKYKMLLSINTETIIFSDNLNIENKTIEYINNYITLFDKTFEEIDETANRINDLTSQLNLIIY